MLKKLLFAAILAAPMCLSAQTMKFGYINPADVFNVMPEVAQVKTTMEAETKKLEDKIAPTIAEARKAADNFQKVMASKTAKDAEKQAAYEAAQKADAAAQEAYQNAQAEMQKKQQELTEPIEKKLSDAIKAVSTEGKYTLVHNLGMQGVIYTGGVAEDIAPKVKAKLGIK